MVQIKYVGKHQPCGMIVDVDEDRAKEFIKSDDYELVNNKKPKMIVEVKRHDDFK